MNHQIASGFSKGQGYGSADTPGGSGNKGCQAGYFHKTQNTIPGRRAPEVTHNKNGDSH